MTKRNESVDVVGEAALARAAEAPRRARTTQGVGGWRGQSLAEYLVVLALVSMALTVGPNSPLEQLFEAVGERYQRFTQEVSRP